MIPEPGVPDGRHAALFIRDASIEGVEAEIWVMNTQPQEDGSVLIAFEQRRDSGGACPVGHGCMLSIGASEPEEYTLSVTLLPDGEMDAAAPRSARGQRRQGERWLESCEEASR